MFFFSPCSHSVCYFIILITFVSRIMKKIHTHTVWGIYLFKAGIMISLTEIWNDVDAAGSYLDVGSVVMLAGNAACQSVHQQPLHLCLLWC